MNGVAAAFLSAKSVAILFDTSVSTVRRWEVKGLIKPVMIGTLKRYDVSSLLQAAGHCISFAAGAGRPPVSDADEATRLAAEARRRYRRQDPDEATKIAVQRRQAEIERLQQARRKVGSK